MADQITTSSAEAKEWEKRYDEIFFSKIKNKEIIKHNERNPGRKSKFTDEQVEEIKKLRAEGKTIKEIGEIYKSGTTTVNRILKR